MELDQQQKDAIFTKFKESVKDCKLFDPSDEYLLKWLTARNYNSEQAEKMLRHSIEWRRLNKVDEILETYQPPEVLSKYFSLGKIGKDKFGCPTYLSTHGRLDMKGMIQSCTKKDYLRFHIYMAEKSNHDMREDNKITGSRNTFMSFIADMEGLSMRQLSYRPAMDVGLEQTKMYEAHYPENLRRIFVINAPKIFTLIFNFTKPFLHQATIDKIRIYGTDREEWLAAILEEIDADQLPAYYGGTMTDPDGDPKCPSKFNMGGEVPREYYMSNTPPVPKDYMETVNIIAGAGGKKKLKFKVDAPNAILKWEFMTEGGDIAYRVYLKDAKGESTDLVPHGRVDSHVMMEEGEIPCEHTGKYVIEFDNTFSYFKPKKVRYAITVESSSKPHSDSHAT